MNKQILENTLIMIYIIFILNNNRINKFIAYIWVNMISFLLLIKKKYEQVKVFSLAITISVVKIIVAIEIASYIAYFTT